MVVTTGSMSPTIPAGSLAFAQDAAADDAEVGDIVAVQRVDGTRVMHRVVTAEPSGDQVALTLQGDANSTPDPEIYVVDRVLAVRFDVPWLGYPVSWLSTPWGLLGLGAVGCGLLLFAFRPTSAPTPGRRRVAALVAVPLSAVVVSTTAFPSSATFTDTGTVTSNTMTRIPWSPRRNPPARTSTASWCSGTSPALPGPTSTPVTSTTGNSAPQAGAAVSSGTVGGGQAAGSTVTLDIGTGLIGVNANYNVVVLARLQTPTTWIAATTTTTPVRRASIIIIGAAMRCGHA